MSLYGTTQLSNMESIANSNEVLEMLIVDDVLRGTNEQIREFVESDFAKVLMEKAVLKKPTMMRLSKQDDQKRRVKLMAYQLAKEANDPNFKKLKLYTAKRKECIGAIMKKYGPKAEKLATMAQKNYIKTASLSCIIRYRIVIFTITSIFPLILILSPIGKPVHFGKPDCLYKK